MSWRSCFPPARFERKSHCTFFFYQTQDNNFEQSRQLRKSTKNYENLQGVYLQEDGEMHIGKNNKNMGEMYERIMLLRHRRHLYYYRICAQKSKTRRIPSRIYLLVHLSIKTFDTQRWNNLYTKGRKQVTILRTHGSGSNIEG